MQYVYTLISNQSALHAFPRIANAVANAVLTTQMKSAKYWIDAFSLPFGSLSLEGGNDSDRVAQMASGIVVAILLGFGFAANSVMAAVNQSKDKECKAKQQLLVMGMSPSLYWIVNLLVDMALFTVPVLLSFLLFAAFGNMFLDKIPFGAAMNKGLTLKMGQTHMQRYLRPLLERIEKGEIDPSFIITHRLKLGDGPDAYKTFRDKKDDCIKVVMTPPEGSVAKRMDGRNSVHALMISTTRLRR